MKLKRIGAGYYEGKRQVTLTFLDGKTGTYTARVIIEKRQDEIKGWNLRMEVSTGKEWPEVLTDYDEHYDNKWEIVDTLKRGTLDKWEYHKDYGWCI
jgi:hypothetical protein